jgi:hypothetical protein
MRPAVQPTKNLSMFDRLSVRLLALFAATFLIGFLALWAYGISTSYLESAIAEQALPPRPAAVVIDPKLRDELSQVMSTDTVAEPVAIKDPFNDRTGIVGLNAAQRSVGGTVTTSGGSSGTTPGSSTVAGKNKTFVPSTGGGGSPGSRGTNGMSEPQIPATEATKQRYVAWLGLAVTGGIPLDPRIFAIDDLLPVGVVDGGNGQQEVMFYSEAAGRTVSFPVGTNFYDGWLTKLEPEGVIFTSNDDRRTERLRPWARALRSVG